MNGSAPQHMTSATCRLSFWRAVTCRGVYPNYKEHRYLYTTFSTTALYIILHLSCSWSRTSFNLMLKRNQCEKEKRNQTLKTKLNKHIIWPCFESLCQCPEQLVCGKPRVCTWCIHNADRCFLSESDIFFLMYRFFKIVNVQTSQAIIYESRVNK